MKKIFLIAVLAAVSAGLMAQEVREGTGMEWVEGVGAKESVKINPNYFGPTDMYGYPYYMSFEERMTAIYGSRYRKAEMNRFTGMTITLMGAPSCALLMAYGLTEWDSAATIGCAVLGAAGLVGSLWGGIKLWSKGRKDLDAMLDDYAKNYGPRYSLSVGPTRSGIGLALNW